MPSLGYLLHACLSLIYAASAMQLNPMDSNLAMPSDQSVRPFSRKGWPTGMPAKLKHTWDFRLSTTKSACTHGQVGVTCSFSITSIAQVPTADVAPIRSAPVFVVLAVGPEISTCATEPAQASNGTFVSRVRCSLHAGGEYELRPLLTYESEQAAHPAPPACSTPCVCSYLRAGGGFPTFTAPSAHVALAREVGVLAQPSGRWVRRMDGSWGWYVYGEDERDLSQGILPPEHCPKLHLIGDSHMKLVHAHLRAHGFRVSYHEANGIQDHNISRYSEVVREADRHNCTFQAFAGGDGVMSLFHGLATLPKLAPGDVVVLGAGTWDLRDVSVEDFLIDYRRLLSKLEAASIGHPGVQFIFRTAPSYSYKMGDKLKGREYRTNEKLREAMEEIKKLSLNKVPVWDTFSITMPRFEESVDTHHYLGPARNSNATGDDRNGIGVADINALLHMVCSDGKSSLPSLSR